MAGIGVSPIMFVSLLLLAIGGAHATFINVNVNVIVTGQVCCTQNGNCPGTPVAGATVTLTCPNPILPAVVGTATTTATGGFSISATITTIPFTINSPLSKCLITVQLPVPAAAACAVLSNSGGRLFTTVTPTGLVNGVQTGTANNFNRLNN